MNKKRKRKKKINLKLIIALIIIVIIAVLVKLIFFKDEAEKTKLGTEVVSQNIVNDEEAPTIELKGKEKVIVAKGNPYKEEGAIANDNIDGDISSKIEIIGEVDTSKIGTYEITYKVKDTSENEANIKREVIVCNSLGSKGLPVLMYHFFYDENNGSGKDNNFIEISDFEEQIKYLSDNNFYFPTWEEVEDYIDGETILPEKSIVLTVDDGDDSFFELAVPVLQKYDVDATSFVITSWYGYRANEKQENVIYESHSDNMHEGGANGKGVMLSWSKDKIIEDLEKSKEVLGGDATIFCYPFGQYNDNAIQCLKEAGYKLAFTTQGGRVYKGSSKYELPRVRIMKTTTINEFKNMVN